MKIEFRIPISPTRGFYSQVRFFNFALRRLGSPYDVAKLSIVVGDNCDIDAVQADNAWSKDENVEWHAVPNDIFTHYGIWGTANWRLMLPAGDADTIILSDADTVLAGRIDQLWPSLSGDEPVVAGHMAHFPPPVSPPAPESSGPDFWPWLFDALDVPVAAFSQRYSMDGDGRFGLVPAYFNLGFIGLNPSALEIFSADIMNEEERILALTGSPMRCQLAITTIAYRSRMRIVALPAEYNLANDEWHISQNVADIGAVRVIHFLREGEMVRSHDLLPENIQSFVARPLSNPANRRVQQLAREYLQHLVHVS